MVSIVVPVYNVEKYLRQCVNSLINQTYKDIEIILVDDGSKDGSGKICDEYAEKYDFIRVIHKENAGLGMARNTGMEAAKGDYVDFMDSDDYLKPNTVEMLVKALTESGADTCLGGYCRFLDGGDFTYSYTPGQNCYSAKEFFPRQMGSLPEKKDAFRPSVTNALLDMSIIREHNLRFKSEREYIAEDLYFDIDYYLYSNKVCTADTDGYCYRVTEGSLTQKYNPQRFEKVVFLYKNVFRKLNENGWGDESILRAKRQFFVYLRMCLHQENIKLSGKTKKQAKENIRKMCGDEFTRSCIENYPVSKMGLPQRVFIFLVKRQSAGLLYKLVSEEKNRGGKA